MLRRYCKLVLIFQRRLYFFLCFTDPDITSGDGVYLRVIPQSVLTTGIYELSVLADDNDGLAGVPSLESLERNSPFSGETDLKSCCGSRMPFTRLKPIAPFFRKITFGIMNIINDKSELDTLPPSKILDLRVSIDNTTLTGTIKWTAPGDDYDWGRVNFFEAVVADTWLAAKKMMGAKIKALPTPRHVPYEHSADFKFTKFEEVLFIAIRGVDSAGNKGEVSNIVTVVVPHPPTTQLPLPPMTFPAVNVINVPSESVSNDNLPLVPYSTLPLNFFQLITGIIFGCAFVLMLIGVICIFRTKRTQATHTKNLKHLEYNPNIMVRANSVEKLNGNFNQDSGDNAVKEVDGFNTISLRSPVHSWTSSRNLKEKRDVSLMTSGSSERSTSDYGSAYQNTSTNGVFPDVTNIGNYSQNPLQAQPSSNTKRPGHQQTFTGNQQTYKENHQDSHQHSNHQHPPYSTNLQSHIFQTSQAHVHGNPQVSFRRDLHPATQLSQSNRGMQVFVSENCTNGAPNMYSQFFDEARVCPLAPTSSKVLAPLVSSAQGSCQSMASQVLVPQSFQSASLDVSMQIESNKRELTEV